MVKRFEHGGVEDHHHPILYQLLHLLDKLKSYGDRGDLGYIVKTQKLGDIRAKEMKDRVQIEDY